MLSPLLFSGPIGFEPHLHPHLTTVFIVRITMSKDYYTECIKVYEVINITFNTL